VQSKASKNRYGRSANAAEKRFQGWVKYQPCVWCGSQSGSIVDHVIGAKQGHNKVHIGHWFVLPNCEECDYKKTVEGEKLGDYAGAWYSLITGYQKETGEMPPEEVQAAIESWGRTWKNG